MRDETGLATTMAGDDDVASKADGSCAANTTYDLDQPCQSLI